MSLQLIVTQVHLSNGNTTYSLRNVYEKYLKEFEEAERDGKVTAMDLNQEQSNKKIKQEIKEEEVSIPRRRVWSLSDVSI